MSVELAHNNVTGQLHAVASLQAYKNKLGRKNYLDSYSSGCAAQFPWAAYSLLTEDCSQSHAYSKKVIQKQRNLNYNKTVPMIWKWMHLFLQLLKNTFTTLRNEILFSGNCSLQKKLKILGMLNTADTRYTPVLIFSLKAPVGEEMQPTY